MSASLYKKYLLVLLLTILAFNYVDRLALGLVMQEIKDDLQLSDTQLGLLTGFSFAVFYSVMGIPIARWADRGNRVTIIMITTALWSTMVALCGIVTSFFQLVLIRVGVAVGEAGAVPPAHSLIADYFSRIERPRAMGIYLLGAPLSAFIGYFGAGWLNELYGWRIMFVLLGIPGIFLAILARFTIREPRCQSLAAGESLPAPQVQPSLREVFRTLWAIPTFRSMLGVFSLGFLFTSGTTQWLPAFFVRTHGMQTGELGTWLALAYGVSGFIGIYYGGAIASRYAPGNERLQLRVLAVLFLIVIFIRPVAFFMPSAVHALVLVVLTSMVNYVSEGPLFAIIQTLVPRHMRAMAIAIIYLCANLIGLGLGPLAVGMLSDAFRPWAGDSSLQYALVALCPGYLWIAWHLWKASQTVTADLDAARAGIAFESEEELRVANESRPAL